MLGFRMLYKGNSLPRAGLILYLGRPNLNAEELIIGEETEIGEETVFYWAFILPDSDECRAATEWVSGAANLFYAADGTPTPVWASDIAEIPGINTGTILFKVVNLLTEEGKLAVYSPGTAPEVLEKAKKSLRIL
jgi:hypothetical protein